MSWVFDHVKLGHRVFIAFIELKIEGYWKKYDMFDVPTTISEMCEYEVEVHHELKIHHEVLSANSKNCIVHVIEPDGLRRILQFNKGGTISINQNILSYHPDQVKEITVDEKEQAGKGRSRDKL